MSGGAGTACLANLLFLTRACLTIASLQAHLTHTRRWFLLDAKGQAPGRVAQRVVPILTGKMKPIYHPTADCGDFVVVTNTKVRQTWMILSLNNFLFGILSQRTNVPVCGQLVSP